jgi:tRNA-splicing ligase RtcB
MDDLTESGKLYTWLVEPLGNDVRSALQRLIRLEDVAHVAVMPDVHLAGEVCIGTVVGSWEVLYPHAVGGDIGCGMVAVSTTLEADRLRNTKVARRLLDRLKMLVPVIKHGSQTAVEALPEYLIDRPLSAPSLERQKHRDARIQLGSLGRGNHFLEFQEDDYGCVWVMVHTGSRSIGQLITRYHLKQATEGTTGLKGILAETKAGRSYLNDVAWARHYATENRAAILEAVAVLLDSMFEVTFIDNSLITCDHNHVQPEIHQDVRLWVHRKGAVPAGVGQPGIIPGSMGSVSFHTLGKGCSHSLCSSSHGAGRLLSRTQASHQISLKALYGQMKGVIFDGHLAARLREEAPAAYKNIGKVMRAQRNLTRVVRRLRPVLSYKGI